MRKIINNWKLNRFKKKTREEQAEFAYQHHYKFGDPKNWASKDYRSKWFEKDVENDIANLTDCEKVELIKNTKNQYLRGVYAKKVIISAEEKHSVIHYSYNSEELADERDECEEKINAFGGIKSKKIENVPYLYDELLGSFELQIILEQSLKKLWPDQDHIHRNKKTICQFQWFEAKTNRPIEPDLLRDIIRLRPENSPTYDPPKPPNWDPEISYSFINQPASLLIINNCCFFEGSGFTRGIKGRLTPYTGKVIVNRGKLAFERQYVEGILKSEAKVNVLL